MTVACALAQGPNPPQRILGVVRVSGPPVCPRAGVCQGTAELADAALLGVAVPLLTTLLVGSSGRRDPDFLVWGSDLASQGSSGSQNLSAEAAKLRPRGFRVELRCTQLTGGRAAAGTAPDSGRSTVPWKMRYRVTLWPRSSRRRPCSSHSRSSLAAGRAGPAPCPGLPCHASRRWVAGPWLESSGLWGNSLPCWGHFRMTARTVLLFFEPLSRAWHIAL